jgi:hypothetical protein
VEVVVAVDALVAREALDLVRDHWNLLLQDSQGDVGVALLELVGQVAELEAHLGIAATHLHLGGGAAEMLDGLWEPRHLEGLLVPQEALEPGRQGLDLFQLLLEGLGLSLDLLRIFLAPGALLGITLLLGFLGLHGLLVCSCFLKAEGCSFWRFPLPLEPESLPVILFFSLRHFIIIIGCRNNSGSLTILFNNRWVCRKFWPLCEEKAQSATSGPDVAKVIIPARHRVTISQRIMTSAKTCSAARRRPADRLCLLVPQGVRVVLKNPIDVRL